jgi:hypothetical protein
VRPDVLRGGVQILDSHNYMIEREHSPMMFEQTAPYKRERLDNRSREVDGRESVPPSSPLCLLQVN